MKILVSDPLDSQAVESMKKAKLDVTVQTGMKPEELLKVIPNYQILIVRSGTKVTRQILEAAKNLKLVVRAGVGLDNIDAIAAKEKDIEVCNTPLATTTSVAEHTFALMLALLRKIPQAHDSLKKGEWKRKEFQGFELKEKVLGIVGLGRIGQEVAKRAKAFGMRILATDLSSNPEIAAALDVEWQPLEVLIQKADILTLHLPLTPKTKHMLNQNSLRKMKKGSYVINAARGGIIDEQALADAIKSGHIAGAAFDVFETEPPTQNPLLALDNVVAVPHLGASTEEGQFRAGQEAANIVIDFAKK